MSRFGLLLCVGAALAGAPPRISLDLGTVDDVVAEYSKVHKMEKLQQSKTGAHSLDVLTDMSSAMMRPYMPSADAVPWMSTMPT